MRVASALLVALPALALAEDQVPLVDKVKGWFNQAQSYVSTAIPAAATPVEAAASKIAETAVANLTLENWRQTINSSASASAAGPQEWMIYVTGGNKTCFGLCGNTTEAWNKSVPLLAAAPSAPNLAVIDCETENILCNTWAASPPSIVHIQVPAPLPDQSAPAPAVRFIPLNRVNTTALNITQLHTEKKYEQTEPYEGIFHPFNGLLVQFGVEVPVAYVFWAFSKMPSWLPMVAISMISRNFMSRRAAPAAAPQGAAPAAAQ